MKTVPTIDISDTRNGNGSSSPARTEEVATALDEACRTSGFFIVTGHGVSSDLIAEVMEVSRQFFNLSSETKQKVAPPGPHHFRGWLGLDTTSLAATLGDDEAPPDLCESFNVSRFDDPEIWARAQVEGAEATFLPNVWPDEPTELRPLFERYYAVMEQLCWDMLPLFARALDLPGDWFNDKVVDHTALLLINWYPPAETVRTGQLRRGAHTDYGAFTMVAAEQIPGLQIFVDDQWSDVPGVPDSFVVNLGDLMARWTNDRWVSTLHRVVIPDGADQCRDRVSVPFFFQPSYRAKIETIPTTITPDRPAKYGPVLSGEWIRAKNLAMLEEQDS